MVPEASLIYDKDRNASVESPDPKADNGRKKIPVSVAVGTPLPAVESIDETSAAMREAMNTLLRRVQLEYSS